MPETKPPKCAKFATLPKPKRSSIPIKPNINHITINKYKAGGSPYLSNLDSISIIIQNQAGHITPESPPKGVVLVNNIEKIT